ncbi:M14 family zinc carboxypeptidase [Maribacter sp. 2307ULW6-5]|uniref:M14 family zinc carboxypeptidase n=1 Tax=Maribacter sp. 2307ULW6-5 TaxID=3386275 RepID=UPI0039BC8F0B
MMTDKNKIGPWLPVQGIKGRYITNDHLEGFLTTLGNKAVIGQVGRSVKGAPIHCLKLGQGPHRILIWSQMHGNEATTTKALMDLVQYLTGGEEGAQNILGKISLTIIPILNPDGARAYTRINANGVDLNRDAQQRTQPESEVLWEVYRECQPHFCFNMHGQRTIFSAGDREKPATVSFLAPAFDAARSLSPARQAAMQLIVAMNLALQRVIPNQVGRYDDGFNPNCTGDAFMMQQTPTVLFEAGHYPNDYGRESTRALIFMALKTALESIADTRWQTHSVASYARIPENQKRFVDVLLHNPHLLAPQMHKDDTVGIMYKEMLVNGEIVFKPDSENVKVGAKGLYGHLALDCANPKHLKIIQERELDTILS